MLLKLLKQTDVCVGYIYHYLAYQKLKLRNLKICLLIYFN